MHHRFHTPYDGCIEHVTHFFSGDTWNVNPVARRAAVLLERTRRDLDTLATGTRIALVGVAATVIIRVRAAAQRHFSMSMS
jgi:phosphatidylserine decarboxylase